MHEDHGRRGLVPDDLGVQLAFELDMLLRPKSGALTARSVPRPPAGSDACLRVGHAP